VLAVHDRFTTRSVDFVTVVAVDTFGLTGSVAEVVTVLCSLYVLRASLRVEL
jgi:hypothetical protein